MNGSKIKIDEGYNKLDNSFIKIQQFIRNKEENSEKTKAKLISVETYQMAKFKRKYWGRTFFS